MRNFTKLIFIAILSLASVGVAAQGIKFETTNYKEVVEAAKSSGKMVMLDFYTDWCVPCKQMEERIFIQKRVGDGVNPNFITLRVDAEKGEGVELAKQFSITGYPTLIFLSSDNEEKYRLRGAPFNVNFFLEVIDVVLHKSIDLNNVYDKFIAAENTADKLIQAEILASRGPAQYSLISGKKHIDLGKKVEEASAYYFENKPLEEMINETGFDIISMFLDGATNERSQIKFIYENYDKFKEVVPEIDLATFVVKVNNESIQKYSRDGDLIWKKFVSYIDKELAGAYQFLGEKNPRKTMTYVANINSALYAEKDYDRYISLRDKYSKLLAETNSDMKGNYFYAAQVLYRQSNGELTPKQINKAIEWLNKNIEEQFNLPATYMLMGDFYAMLPDKKPEAIYNYNRCVAEAKKQGPRMERRYTSLVTEKINELKNK